MVIVQHYPHSAKHYAETEAGGLFPIPTTCPDCGAVDTLIRWGFYKRQARTGLAVYRIRVQRVRCTACEHTHSLLPDFLHPYRHYVLSLLQRVISLSTSSAGWASTACWSAWGGRARPAPRSANGSHPSPTEPGNCCTSCSTPT